MIQRVFLFFITNLLVIATVSVVINILGLNNYITQYGLDYSTLFLSCLVWGMVGSFISLSISKWMAKNFMGVKLIDESGPHSDVFKSVYEISKKAGLSKFPEVGIFESESINAFATGPSRNNSLVAVSTGLLRKLNKDQQDAVIAHEVAHIANGDMITTALLQGVLNAFVMFFARVITYAIDNATRDENGRGGLGFFTHFIVLMVLQTLFGILASIPLMAFSRWREFRADAGSAQLVGGDKMISALKELQRDYEILTSEKDPEPALNVMGISSKKSLVSLFSSHPPLEERIQRLES